MQIAPNERQNCVQYGDALFTLSSETPEEVGIGAVYLDYTQKLLSFELSIFVLLSIPLIIFNYLIINEYIIVIPCSS